jgi:hypothetical protein
VSVHPISRLVPGSTLHNTINIRTVKVFFQKSPGKPSGAARGIPDLDCRILNDGNPVRVVRSAKDGLVEVPLSNDAATLEILHQGQAVSQYDISIEDAPFDSAETLRGQQQRLRHLGYQLGHGGPNGDGVDANVIANISPLPKPPPDPERDADDEELSERKKKERKDNPDIQETLFKDMTFHTERSILDFQADSSLFVDARVGPKTRAKLVGAVGE